MTIGLFLRVFASRSTSILTATKFCNRPIQNNINPFSKILMSAFKGGFNFHSFDFGVSDKP